MTRKRYASPLRASREKTGFSVLAAVVTILGAQQIAAAPSDNSGAHPMVFSEGE